MEAGRKITRRGKKKKKRWMDATYAVPVSRCSNVSREIKSSPIWNKNRKREKKTGDPLAEEGKNSLSLSGFLIRINRVSKRVG